MDALTSTYTLSCPHRGQAKVRLSSFRSLERLPGASHPVVYQVLFSCGCGEQHPGLMTETELDWVPLGLEPGRCTFVNLMTSRHVDLAEELAAIALAHIGAGEWPWSFFCCREERSRPVTPSSFVLLAPTEGKGGTIGLAVRCPWCGSVSLNVVSEFHVDVPFWNDASIGVVEHVFDGTSLPAPEAFKAALHSAVFDERRLELGQ